MPGSARRRGVFTNAQLANLDRLIEVKRLGIEEDWADDVAEVSAEVAAVTVDVMQANAEVGNIEGAAASAVAAGVAAGVAFVAAAWGDTPESQLFRNEAARRAMVRAVDAIPLETLIDVRRMAIERRDATEA